MVSLKIFLWKNWYHQWKVLKKLSKYINLKCYLVVQTLEISYLKNFPISDSLETAVVHASTHGGRKPPGPICPDKCLQVLNVRWAQLFRRNLKLGNSLNSLFLGFVVTDSILKHVIDIFTHTNNHKGHMT